MPSAFGVAETFGAAETDHGNNEQGEFPRCISFFDIFLEHRRHLKSVLFRYLISELPTCKQQAWIVRPDHRYKSVKYRPVPICDQPIHQASLTP